jgi:hypothetical protein
MPSGLFPVIIKALNQTSDIDFAFAQFRVKPVAQLIFADSITISGNPARVNTDVAFTLVILPAGKENLITSFAWAFYD